MKTPVQTVARVRALDGNVRGVPVVDLETLRHGSVSARHESVEALRVAFETIGFVRLRGHAVPSALLARVDEGFRHFFDLDPTTKAACGGVAGGQRGYTPFGVEHAKGHDRPDLKAFFHVGQPRPLGSEASTYPTNVFPDEPAWLETVALELYVALERVAGAVLAALEQGFKLPEGCLVELIEGGNSILRALDYPALGADAFAAAVQADGLRDGRAIRAARHEDINLVTLLPASSEPGLEILLPPSAGRGAGWLAVRAEEGEIVADVGDMLARVFGCRLPATPHRVVVDGGAAARRRTAYPFFAHPRPECDLSVRPELVAPGAEPPLPPITAGAFLAQRLAEIGLAEPG